MSTRHSKTHSHQSPTQRRKALGLQVAGILIGAIVITLFLISSTRSGSTNAATGQQVTGAPRLLVVQDTFDYGNVALGTPVETVFRVRNVGDQPLLILNDPQVQVIAGCCPPKAVLSSKVIQPGQEATITLNFTMHAGMDGKHQFNINLRTNDPNATNKLLMVLSNWV